MKKRQKMMLFTLMIMLALSFTTISLAAGGSGYNIKDGEVVFLLDTSASMNTQDKYRLAIDAVRQGAHGLPSNYETGLVAYNTGIQAVVPLNQGQEQLNQQLETITYTGYTNAGDGLSQAVNLFSDRENVDRFVIMLSDGEIDMPDPAAKEQSRSQYTEMVKQAKENGVRIYIIAIGSELTNPQMHIFAGAEQTDGAIYWSGQSESLAQIMERIISERMDFPKQALQIGETNNQIHTEIPKGASRIKLLIAADREIGEILTDYPGDGQNIISGQEFVIVDIPNPSADTLNVSLSALDEDGAVMKSYLLTEYKASPRIAVDYRIEEIPRSDKEIKKNVPPEYNHFADVTIDMADISGKSEPIWDDAYEGNDINYTINGTSYTGTVQQGQLHQTLDATVIDKVEVSVDTGGLDAVYYVEQPVTEKIEKTPDPIFEPKPDYRPLIGIIAFLAAAFIALLVLWTRKKNTTIIYVAQSPMEKEPAKRTETKSCMYSGKLNMYVVRTADGRDIPPQTYRLFGRGSGRQTLNQILVSCGIKFGKIGAEDIVLYPGPDHTLIIMDQSEGCTVMRGMEILKKGMGYPVSYNEKLTVSFEDEATELEIHYKNIKPSERGEFM